MTVQLDGFQLEVNVTNDKKSASSQCLFVIQTNFSADCPTDVTINPATGPYAPGDELTCSADGYDPTYEWTGVFNGVQIATHMGSSYTLLEGDFQVICTATITQLTCTGDASDSVEGSSEGCPVGKY